MKKLGRAGSTFGTVVAAAVVLTIATTGGAVAGGLITSKQIKNDTIKSVDVKDGSLAGADVADFSLSNQDVGVLWAQVNADGTLANSSGGVSSSHVGTGKYQIDWGRNTQSCAFVATQGEDGVGSAPGAIVGVTDRSGNPQGTYLTTRDAAGSLVDEAVRSWRCADRPSQHEGCSRAQALLTSIRAEQASAIAASSTDRRGSGTGTNAPATRWAVDRRRGSSRTVLTAAWSPPTTRTGTCETIRAAWSAAASYAARAWLSRRRANRCWLWPPALVRPCTCRWPTLESTTWSPTSRATANPPLRTSRIPQSAGGSHAAASASTVGSATAAPNGASATKVDPSSAVPANDPSTNNSAVAPCRASKFSTHRRTRSRGTRTTVTDRTLAG